MKKVLLIVFALAFGVLGHAAMPILDPELREAMNRCSDNEKLKINILMLEQSDPVALQRAASSLSTNQSAPLTKIASPPTKQITKNHIVDNN